MKLQELFEAERKQKLNEAKEDQWDIRVNDSNEYIQVMGNIRLDASISFMEIYMDFIDDLRQKGYSKEQISEIRSELRDAISEMKKEDSIEEQVEKISTIMYGLLSSLVHETAQKREQQIKDKLRAIAEGNKKNEI